MASRSKMAAAAARRRRDFLEARAMKASPAEEMQEFVLQQKAGSERVPAPDQLIREFQAKRAARRAAGTGAAQIEESLTVPKPRGSLLGGLAKGGIAALIIGSLLRKGMEFNSQALQGQVEQGQRDLAELAMSPNMVQQQTMLPITRAQKQAALYMLMQKMGQGSMTPMLAEGESLT